MGEPDAGHQRVVIYWTLHSDTSGTLACELSRTQPGLVVRCLDQSRKVVLSERVAAAADAAEIAAQWKARLLEKGDYFERHPPAAHRQVKTPSSRRPNGPDTR
jgi:hypothetical protein